MAKKKKFYVVWSGNNPGIYESWKECELQIKGYPNAKYKGFSSLHEAQMAFGGGVGNHLSRKKSSKKVLDPLLKEKAVITPSWSVDAACSGNPGDMEYQGVLTENGTQIFHMGPFKKGTNNVGEFLALVHALALLKRQGDSTTPIYSDSKIAMGWVQKKKCNTKLVRSRQNEPLFVLIQRAESWLKNNTFQNKMIKWNTKEWGEIPADFGRK